MKRRDLIARIISMNYTFYTFCTAKNKSEI